MALRYKFNLLGENGRVLRKYVLDASQDWQVGDVVTMGTGETDLAGDGAGEAIIATAGRRILGVIQAIVTVDGVSPANNGCGGAFVDQYRTAANNETAAQVSAIVDISPFSVYSADLDDTINTTTGSELPFYYFDLDTGTANHQLDEASASAPSTGSGQFVSHGRDPEDSNNVLVSVRETFLMGDSGY